MAEEGIKVEAVTTRGAMNDFAMLPFHVYSAYPAWWPPDVDNEIELLRGRSPISSYLELMPLMARRGSRPVARATAVINRRYNEHWNERLGQLIHFEAMPGEAMAAIAVLQEAVNWFKSREMNAVRSGFAAFLDYPYAIDGYGALSSFLLRGNPDYYHSYFKMAGFATEKGLSDFTIALDSETLSKYPAMLAAVEREGIVIRSWQEYGYASAMDAWTDVINSSFAGHWGWNPIMRSEVRPMLAGLAQTEVAQLSTVALAGRKPVGVVFAVPDFSPRLAQIRPATKLSPERGGGTRGALINVGVLDACRGRGVAAALAVRSFQSMVRLGMKYAGYTLVLDDNWPSRRTASKLGGLVTNNFVVYRRDF